MYIQENEYVCCLADSVEPAQLEILPDNIYYRRDIADERCIGRLWRREEFSGAKQQ